VASEGQDVVSRHAGQSEELVKSRHGAALDLYHVCACLLCTKRNRNCQNWFSSFEL
jgi:hypothetical protein